MSDKPVMICTKHRGVFGGLVPTDQDMLAEHVVVRDCRMAIHWGTTKGVHQLADTGPTSSSKISAAVTLVGLRDVTAIYDMRAEAWEQWSR